MSCYYCCLFLSTISPPAVGNNNNNKKKMSTRVLLQWLNGQLDTNMTKIVEMGEGWQYCQLLHILFDKEMPMAKVVLKARNEEQRLANFKIVMNILAKKGADFPSGDIDIQKLAKGQQTHNLSFLNWFKRWFDCVVDGEELPEYNASRVRSQQTSSRTPVKTPTPSRRKRDKPEPLPRLNLNSVSTAPTAEVKTSSANGIDENENPAMFFLQKKRCNSTNPTKRHKPVVVTSNQITVTATPAAAPVDARPEPKRVERQPIVSSRDESTIKQLREDNKKLEKNAKELEAKLADSVESSKTMVEKTKEAEKQVYKLRDDKQQLSQELKNIRDKMAALQRDVQTASVQLREKEDTLSQAEQVRRMLHNSLQELKGNIRVFARLRPSLGTEEVTSKMFGFPDKLDFRKITVQEANTTSATGNAKAGKLSHFEFDRAFGPTSTQEDIFSEVSQMVHSAMDGYKVCIFAYGQTGSGKTYTMEGGPEGDEIGLIPRTVQLLFDRSGKMKEFGWELNLSLRYVEIYNEKIRDLLSDDGGEKLAAMDKKIEIHHNKDTGDTYLSNCTTIPVHSIEGVHDALRLAGSRRTVSATKMNDSSSRSHSVFTLKVQGRNSGIDQTMNTEINLIDLAGSERVKDSGVTGEALKEAEHINTSLTHLGNVIQAIHAARKNAGTKSHVFRNSPLTWMLKPCLGGDCKTLMMVNISPVVNSVNETINSLRFATKVNNCQIGSASRRLK